MVNRWNDDDEVTGFGLLEGEEPAGQKAKPTSKKSPKTRHLRDKAEWTPADVASEFSWRIYNSIRGIPNMVNTQTLAILLAKNRKQFGVTATVELALLDKFLGDERNLIAVKRKPSITINIFLTFITNNINKLSQTDEVTNEEIDNSLIASDGKLFDNSVIGKTALERYEAKLGGQK